MQTTIAGFGNRLAWDHDVSTSSPVVRGTWVTANNVVSLVKANESYVNILDRYRELTQDDLNACVDWYLLNQ